MTEKQPLIPIEAINEFYKLKEKYESVYYEKYVKPIVTSNKSKREKRVEYSKLPKHECINCKRHVNTIFKVSTNHNELLKTFLVKCGDFTEPCPLDIQINYAFRDQFDTLIRDGLQQIESIKLQVIKEKNNALFFKKYGFCLYYNKEIKRNISLIKKDFNNRIKVKLGDFKSLDFAKNYFDFVTCNGVLYYDSKINVAKGVKEIYRVMKSKGICRIYLLSSNDYNFKIKNYFEKSYKIPLKRTFFNYKEIKKIFFPFKKVLIGKHDFNFIDYKKKHSYWVITAYK